MTKNVITLHQHVVSLTSTYIVVDFVTIILLTYAHSYVCSITIEQSIVKIKMLILYDSLFGLSMQAWYGTCSLNYE